MQPSYNSIKSAKPTSYYCNTVCNANLNPLLVKHIDDALNERASKEATAQTRCCDCFSRQTHTSNLLMFYPPSNL